MMSHLPNAPLGPDSTYAMAMYAACVKSSFFKLSLILERILRSPLMLWPADFIGIVSVWHCLILAFP